jgi:hypothetical protein
VVARIKALNAHHVIVGFEAWVQLLAPHVNTQHACCTLLQQTISKTTCTLTDIDAPLASRTPLGMRQGACKLSSAT